MATRTCPTPSPEMAFGSHKWVVGDDGGTCANCGQFKARDNSPRMARIDRSWATATAGYTFAEDLNSDGTLPSDD